MWLIFFDESAFEDDRFEDRVSRLPGERLGLGDHIDDTGTSSLDEVIGKITFRAILERCGTADVERPFLIVPKDIDTRKLGEIEFFELLTEHELKSMVLMN